MRIQGDVYKIITQLERRGSAVHIDTQLHSCDGLKLLYKTLFNNRFVPEVVFKARLDVAGSSISAGETNTGIDGYFTVVTLEERTSKKKRL